MTDITQTTDTGAGQAAADAQAAEEARLAAEAQAAADAEAERARVAAEADAAAAAQAAADQAAAEAQAQAAQSPPAKPKRAPRAAAAAPSEPVSAPEEQADSFVLILSTSRLSDEAGVTLARGRPIMVSRAYGGVLLDKGWARHGGKEETAAALGKHELAVLDDPIGL
jgi:hypothetical protein